MKLTSFDRIETQRVRNHLARALALVSATRPKGLNRAQRMRRASLVDELARYRQRGRFPQNDWGVMAPAFIDSVGTRCALAHLIDVTGENALVERVATTSNHARVAELAADDQLLGWLHDHGLTVQEAAAIQPAYCYAASDCICSLYFSATIIEGTALDYETLEITAIHGDPAGLVIGQTLMAPRYSFVAAETWLAGYVDGSAAPYLPLLDTSTLDTTYCGGGPSVFPPPTLSKQVFLDIAFGAPCHATLANEDPQWMAEDTTGCGSPASSTTTSGATSSGTGATSGNGGQGGSTVVTSDGCTLHSRNGETDVLSLVFGAAIGVACTRRMFRRRADSRERE